MGPAWPPVILEKKNRKIKDDKEAEFYLIATKEYGWSRNVLLNQINAKAYKRALSVNKTHNFQTALPEYLSEQADEALKSEYSLFVN